MKERTQSQADEGQLGRNIGTKRDAGRWKKGGGGGGGGGLREKDYFRFSYSD